MQRLLRQMLATALVAGLTIALLLRQDLLPSVKERRSLFEVATFGPYLLLGVVAFLGVRIHQTRIAISALSLALGYSLLLERSSSYERAAAIWIALPLGAALLFRLRESKLLGTGTLAKAIAAAAPISLLVFGANVALPAALRAFHWHAFHGALPGPDLAVLAILLAVLGAALEKDPHLRVYQLGFLLSLAPLLVASVLARNAAVRIGAPATLALGAGGAALGLLTALFEIYWEKVYIDELTAVPNRRALNEHLRTLDGQFAIAMVDIDFFKKFNDTYGHDEGDHVLRFVAAHLAKGARTRVFRYGGEEFCIVYDRADAKSVLDTLDGVRKTLSEREFTIRSPRAVRKRTSKKDRGSRGAGRGRLKVTVSMGLSEPKSPTRVGPDAVMVAADKALYKAKREGRNRVVLA
jgi:diguanylate cyclase (GGDEF)-like protein